jgi:branched-chain amino acid transport system permease protein
MGLLIDQFVQVLMAAPAAGAAVADQIGLAGQLIQYFMSGLTVGAIYAIVAIGFNIIYNATEIINFAQGEFVMLGGLVMISMVGTLHLPLWLGFLATVGVVTLVGLAMERLAIFPLRQAGVMRLVIITIALSILIKGIAMFIWGKDTHSLAPFTSWPPFDLFQAKIMPQTVWIIGVTAVLVIVLTVFFNRTIIGKAMRACADNPEAARLVGINVRRMVMLSFMLSAALGAVAGIVVTPVTMMEYDRGAMLALKGFGAAIFGGLGNFYGAVAAGFLLGLMESFTTGFISSAFKDAVAVAVLLGVLYVRPTGLFGSSQAAGLRKF